jgi:hypothetical protein
LRKCSKKKIAMPPDLEIIQQRLGYTPTWLEVGIVTHALLLEQWRVFQQSGDQNPEHYRHGVFVAFLESRSGFTDAEVEQLHALEDGDEHDLRQVRLVALLHSQKISPAQRHWLATRDEWRLNKIVQKIVLQQTTLESLHEHGLTQDTFATVQTSQDAVLHETVLGRHDLTREHLSWLAEFGASKTIRNRTKEKLRSKRFRTDSR